MIILESSFPSDFRKDEVGKILNYALTGKFCQLVCVPGGGKATILRLLAHNRNLLKFHLKDKDKEKALRFIYINLLELTSYDETQIAQFLFFALLNRAPKSNDKLVITKELHENVNSLTGQGHTLVFLFDHFDECQNQLPRSFFQLLKDLNTLAKYKFSAVFGTRRDLKDLVDPDILNKYYDFFIGNTVYIKIQNEKAANFLISQTEQVFQNKLPEKERGQIIKITGGHAKLTKVTTELILRENIMPESQPLLANPLTKAALFEIWFYLTAQEQQELRQLAEKSNPKENEVTDNLKRLGLILENSSFAIPLFKEFITTTITKIAPEKISYDPNSKEIKKGESIISDLLSPQEYRLLKFLIENQDKILERDEVIKIVWPDAQVIEGISDEAVDQMIFRLRKKIEDDPNSPEHIVTVKGLGWRFSS